MNLWNLNVTSAMTKQQILLIVKIVEINFVNNV